MIFMRRIKNFIEFIFDEYGIKDVVCVGLLVLEILFLLVTTLVESYPIGLTAWINFLAILWTVAFWRYKNYINLEVKILYWGIFSILSLAIVLFTFAPRKIALILNLVLGYISTIVSLILYRRKIRNFTGRVKIKYNPHKRKKIFDLKEDNFSPIGWCIFIVFFLAFSATAHLNHLEDGIMILIGGGIGFLVALSLIIFACCSKTNYLVAIDKKTSERIATLLLALMMGVGLGWSTIRALNCGLDGEPQIYSAQVVDMQISTGKVSTYYLKIVFEKGEMRISVPQSRYDKTESGDTVTIEYYEGAFGFAYTYVP